MGRGEPLGVVVLSIVGILVNGWDSDHRHWENQGVDYGDRHVLIHEIGHHFGLSDEDMERIEEQA